MNLKEIYRHRKILLDIAKIVLKNGYNYNAMFRQIMYFLVPKSAVAYNLQWFDNMYTDAGHTRIERKDGKIIITFTGDF